MSKKIDTQAQIWLLHKISILAYVLAIVAAIAFMASAPQQIYVTYLTSNGLLSQDNTVFATAFKTLFELSLRAGLIVVLVLSLVSAVLTLTRQRDTYQKALHNHVWLWRWIGLGVTSALMVEIIAILTGVQDFLVLKVLAGLMVMAGLLSWRAESENKETRQPEWFGFTLSIVAGLLVWLVIAASAIGTLIHGGVRSPWYVYALYGVSIVGFTALAVNQKRYLKRRDNWQNYLFVERNYIVIDLVTKLAFAAVLIIGLRRP